MELVHFKKTINIPVSGNKIKILKEGHGYVMAQIVANQIKDIHGADHISMTNNFEQVYGSKKYQGEPLDNKTLIIWRTGGAGDLLFLSPSIRKLKELYPTCKVNLATSGRYSDIFKYFPYTNQRYILPLEEEAVQSADYWCIFEGLIESAQKAKTQNAYDIFAERLGVVDKMTSAEKQPILEISPSEEAWADKLVQRYSDTKYFIGIQVSSSAVLRTFDAGAMRDIALYYASTGNTVFMFGGQRDADPIDLLIKTSGNDKGIVNVAKISPNWIQSAALIKRMNLMITPDSSLSHFAAAVDTPILGIFGPFKSDVRLKYYKNAVAIDANAICPSCFQHGQLPCRWISNPQENSLSKCFECIKTDMIIEVANQILEATK